MSQSRAYLDIVRRGVLPERLENPFIGDARDEVRNLGTPVGTVSVLVLGNRKDFERFAQVIGHRCEPQAIMPAVGAKTFFGVNNWRKILAHREEYEKGGGRLWGQEFRKFTQEKENYQDIVCVVSQGPYSGVERPDPGWAEESLNIRIWHEMTHIVCRKLYPENKHAVRDEVVADMMGLLKTYRSYDTELAAHFLGIQGGRILPSGRLRHYVKEPKEETAELCVRMIAELSRYAEGRMEKNTFEIFEILEEIERKKIGMIRDEMEI